MGVAAREAGHRPEEIRMIPFVARARRSLASFTVLFTLVAMAIAETAGRRWGGG